MLTTFDFPRPREHRGQELSFIGTFTDLSPLRSPRVRLPHLDLPTIPEGGSEPQDNDDTSSLSTAKFTDMEHSIIGNSQDYPHSNAHAEEPTEAEVDTAHHPTRSEEDLLLIEAGYGPSANCVQSTPTTSPTSSSSESAGAEPQSQSSTENSPHHTGDLVASKGVPKYYMLAVRGRHRASVALAADLFADEEANIVRPEDFVCAEDYGMGYRGE